MSLLIGDLLDRHLSGVTRVIDVTSSHTLSLAPYVRLPREMAYEIVSGEAELELAADCLVLGLVGPDPERHGSLEAVVQRVLPVLPFGARGVLLLGWDADRLPVHQILPPLVRAQCQVLDVVPLDYGHVTAAVVFARVQELLPLTGYLSEEDGVLADSLEVQLRLVAEYQAAQHALRLSRRRAAERRRLAEAAASVAAPGRLPVPAPAALEPARVDKSELDELGRENRRLVGERNALSEDLARTEARLAAIRGSRAYRLGVTLAEARGREAAKAPGRLWQLFRDREPLPAAPAPKPKAREHGVARDDAAAPTPSTRGNSAFVTGFGASWSPRTRLAIAGVLTTTTAAALEPDADLLALQPNTGSLLLDGFGADLLLIESAAMRPGGAWAYAGAPSGTVRDRDLAELLDLAHARGIPTVFWWTSAVAEHPRLQRVAASCTLVVADPSLTTDLQPLTRGVQLRRFNPIGAAVVREELVHVGSLDRRTPARAVEPLVAGLRRAASHDLVIYGDTSALVEGPLRACGFPPDLVAHVRGDRSWRHLPALYRRAAAVTATNSSWQSTGFAGLAVADAERLACGAPLVHPDPSDYADDVPGRDRILDVRALPPGEVSAERGSALDVLREIYPVATTVVQLAQLVDALGLQVRHHPLAQRTVTAVVRMAEVRSPEELVASVLHQRHRPTEVLVVVEHDADAEQAVRALDPVTAANIRVRAVAASPGHTWLASAARARGEWLAHWSDAGSVQGPCYLLDRLLSVAMTGADVVSSSATDVDGDSVMRLGGALMRRSVVRSHPHDLPPWDSTAELTALRLAGVPIVDVSVVPA